MKMLRILGILFFLASVAFANPAPADEVSLMQLSETVASMMQNDEEIKRQLHETSTALLETQKAVQKVLKNPKVPGGVPPPPPVPISSEMEQFATQVVSAIREIGTRESMNDTQLADILDELKEINKNFQNYVEILSCPPPFLKMGHECFNVILEDVSWEEARSRCLRMGADLAVPADINSLKAYVGERYPRKNMRNFWIGGKNQEKVWKWLSGDLIDDRLWHVDEPSGIGACLAMFDGWENPLTDFPCENERRAICERAIRN